MFNIVGIPDILNFSDLPNKIKIMVFKKIKVNYQIDLCLISTRGKVYHQ